MPPTTGATPQQCRECGAAVSSPACCPACGAIGDFESADLFALLDVPRRFDLPERELREHYLRLARQVHPDRLAAAPGQRAERGLALSARLNEAYDTLRDPVRRAEYLLLQAGGESAAEDRTVPQEVLMETLMLREEIDAARAAQDKAALETLREQARAGYATALESVAEAARRLPDDPFARRDLRLRLNAIRYYQRMLEQFEP